MKNLKQLIQNRTVKYNFTSLKKVLNLMPLFLMILVATGCTVNKSSSADAIRGEVEASSFNTYVIERNIPGAGKLTPADLKNISKTSNEVLDEMDSEIQWLHSYVTGDKVFCVYNASNEDLIKQHAEKGGFPVNSINQIATIIDPETGK